MTSGRGGVRSDLGGGGGRDHPGGADLDKFAIKIR